MPIIALDQSEAIALIETLEEAAILLSEVGLKIERMIGPQPIEDVPYHHYGKILVQKIDELRKKWGLPEEGKESGKGSDEPNGSVN